MMSRHSGTDRRGQLYLDFIVGIGVFLLAMAFVLSFAPGMFSAFDDDPAKPLVADRTASRLSGPVLGGSDEPSVLNATCVQEFFTESGGICGFDHDSALTERVGIDSLTRLNISVTRPRRDSNERVPLCIENGGLVTCPQGAALTIGRPLPAHETSVTTTYRTVHVDGRDATLTVRVW